MEDINQCECFKEKSGEEEKPDPTKGLQLKIDLYDRPTSYELLWRLLTALDYVFETFAAMLNLERKIQA